MFLVILIIILSLLAGLVIRLVLASRKCHVPTNSNKCMECGEQVPTGYHLCMRCWSYSQTDKGLD